MERNERLKAADKCASRYTNENEARIARAAFMLGCEFEAQGEVVKGVILETEEESWKPSEEQMIALQVVLDHGVAAPDREAVLAEKHLESLYEQLDRL